MPNESKKRAQTSNINESNSVEFFKSFGQVKSTTSATKIGSIDWKNLEREREIMKQKNGQQYSASSVHCAIAAIHQHLIKHSVISGINIHDQVTFLIFGLNGKLKFLSDLGLNDTKDVDALFIDEILQFLIIKYWIVLYQGKEHFALHLKDFKKREDCGFTVYIYCSKINQRGAFGNSEKADKALESLGESTFNIKNNHVIEVMKVCIYIYQ
ncbi:14802_t:CDS:2 [Funneliformis mosseae]|uniref:14802_t:CDS:1 n=1 Tax=Funneliformis mosseae TaxID=27381 RepID=A0A9N9GQT5_FUNMO|nr:14802_t:CDS:2 [Funneliformis mosseae]